MALLRRIPEVDARAAADRLASGSVALDVRELDEWEAGRIAGSRHIPMGVLVARQDELPAGMPIVVVCRSGQRSAAVTEALVRAGYEAENLAGGLHAWVAAGLPIEPPGGRVA
ncbi:MAG: rhodanese-like domain-containing protein [Thermoleophilia bacterium]|nr:rhodanese-like domain-containing protein [Thermoleophilia bacterium]